MPNDTRLVVNCAPDAELDAQLKEYAARIAELAAGNTEASLVEAEQLMGEARELIQLKKAAAVQVVDLSAEEQADLDAFREQAAAERAQHEAEDGRAHTLRERLEGGIPQLVAGANAIRDGQLFANRSAQEKAYLELLGRGTAALARLALRKLDAAD